MTKISENPSAKTTVKKDAGAQQATEPAPAKWAEYLTTGDKTDLSEAEIAACNSWRFSVTEGRPSVITISPQAEAYFDEWRGEWGIPGHPPFGNLHDYQITFLGGADHD